MLIYEDTQAVCPTAAASTGLHSGLRQAVCLNACRQDCLALPWFIWLVSFPSRCLWFFAGLFGYMLVCMAVALACLHPSVVFMCMWVCGVCMCVGGILLVEVGSCLQSGSQQSPDLWPSHSRTTTNRLRLLFFAEKPLPHLSWLHPSSFLSPQHYYPHPHLSIF